MKTIQDLKINETAKVVKLHGTSAVKRHIMDMGITKGTEVTLVRVAPMGDPIELIVRGYSLSIRASEAKEIEIE
ncbi:MAG: ferrous iron transport protein A [Ezakiella sp.]|nr:ferrous iron transport protein A [Ezakiella sp.]MDD7471372.1 ferrous iron transport protein A [Bacillota bacterium]MDY3922869.1 ferrous iron transport protein A [Ezakiella sp.]